MLTVYEFEDGDILVLDGEVNEHNMHLEAILSQGDYKKTVFDSGAILIRSDLKVEKF